MQTRVAKIPNVFHYHLVYESLHVSFSPNNQGDVMRARRSNQPVLTPPGAVACLIWE